MSDEDVPDLGPVPRRLSVDAATVSALVADQLPQWAHLPVAPVRTPGWDNLTFHLGDELLVRLPSAAEYALAVPKEHRWLPALAPHLPVQVPTPLALGRPGHGYPFAWSVYAWLPGAPARPATLADPAGLAADLASFVQALRRVDPSDGPRPGVHNWFRGATLRTYDATARAAVADLGGLLDPRPVLAAWDHALAARWDGVDVWFHGDLAAGNLLLDDAGRLSAVVDFGTCGVGDPACDLAVGWALLDPSGRALLRERLGVDAGEWARGRGWALWKALRTWANAVEDGDGGAAAHERAVVEAVVADHVADPDGNG